MKIICPYCQNEHNRKYVAPYGRLTCRKCGALGSANYSGSHWTWLPREAYTDGPPKFTPVTKSEE